MGGPGWWSLYLAPLAGRGRIASAMRSIVRCNPGEGVQVYRLTTCSRKEPLTPTFSPQARGEGIGAVLLLRHRLFRNLPFLAVEDRDVQRLHRRVVVGRVAEIDVVEEERRVEAGQRRCVLQHVGAGQVVAAAAQDFG